VGGKWENGTWWPRKIACRAKFAAVSGRKCSKQTARHNMHIGKTQWKMKNVADEIFFYNAGFFQLTDETFSFSDADNFDFPAV